MSETKFVVPADGLQVRDPATGAVLPAEGAEVPLNTYWLRRLGDGDVREAIAPKSTTKKEK